MILRQIRRPLQDVLHSARNVGIRSLARSGELDVHFDRQGLDARDALGSMLGLVFFCVAANMTCQCPDSVLDLDADLGGVD